MHEEERDRRVMRYELGKRLLVPRDGDVEPMIEALVTMFEGDLVAVRDRGREALVYRSNEFFAIGATLDAWKINTDGTQAYGGRLENDVDLEDWLEEHRDELDWVHHEYRE
ncbi:hypothetical protein CP556_08750 [Natrinema sp. CBA1119]|uniref:hypothetical protein n=1 Tax=Natrinema sp. CBA1119 TaxID=1608465 RepID=UPI000BF3FB6F|nr:hypothetical protein [Natrinema sp. CBA1119]PGF16192.1 hypothetical protein CP556_08750 [Natrinema sp. CBA1119]